MRVAVAGVGNNTSALVQGLDFYRQWPSETAGLARPEIDGIRPQDIEVVAAFDTSSRKVGVPLSEAIFIDNVFPGLPVATIAGLNVRVSGGISDSNDPTQIRHISAELIRSDVDVLLLSLPANLAAVVHCYAVAALNSGVAVVNCSPDRLARIPDMLAAFRKASLPLIGDDLASQFGSSLVHRAILDLARSRGMSVRASYQVNIGGNADFANLSAHPDAKRDSKLNVLTSSMGPGEELTVVPSGGYIPSLGDVKVAFVSIEGVGWANLPFSLELRLRVQDSANAAGVIVDLLRIAAAARRVGDGGFPDAAKSLLKSPPGSAL